MMLQIDGSPEPGGTSYCKRVLRWIGLIRKVESFFAFTYNAEIARNCLLQKTRHFPIMHTMVLREHVWRDLLGSRAACIKGFKKPKSCVSKIR